MPWEDPDGDIRRKYWELKKQKQDFDRWSKRVTLCEHDWEYGSDFCKKCGLNIKDREAFKKREPWEDPDQKDIDHWSKRVTACKHDWDGDFCKKCGVNIKFREAFKKVEPWEDFDRDNRRKAWELKKQKENVDCWKKFGMTFEAFEVTSCEHDWDGDVCKKCGLNIKFREAFKKREP